MERGTSLTRRGLVSLGVLLALGCAPASRDDTDLEAGDPNRLTWVGPSDGEVVEVGEPVDLAVATQNPAARAVRFEVDGREVGVCEPSRPGEDCFEDGVFQWTVALEAPGRHRVTASFRDAAGAEVVTSRSVESVAAGVLGDDGEADGGGSAGEPDPFAPDRLVAEGDGQIVEQIVGARGFIDPSRPLHRAFPGGLAWAVRGGRVLLEHGRIDGSVSDVDVCVQRYDASVERYGDVHRVSRGSLFAATAVFGNCAPGRRWTRPLVRAAACAVVQRLSREECRRRMADSADFGIEVATRYLASGAVRRRHRSDPPKIAAVLAVGAVRQSGRNRWRMRAPGDFIDRYVAAYNAYRTWEGTQGPTSAGTWTPVFSDRFEGAALGPAWHNSAPPDSAAPLDQCAYVRDGVLHVPAMERARCRVRTGQVFGLNSATSMDAGSTYFFATRMKLHTTEGHHSSFWLTSTGADPTSTNADLNEIDIIENFGDKNEPTRDCDSDPTDAVTSPNERGSGWHGLLSNFYGHYDPHGGVRYCITTAQRRRLQPFDGRFHVFAAEWSPGQYVRFLMDGIVTATFGRAHSSHKAVTILLTNIADHAGPYGPADEMLVQWVRAWKRSP